MKKFSMTLVLLVAGLVTGCQDLGSLESPDAIGVPGLADSGVQRARRIAYIRNFQRKMLIDDWDMVWLNERSSRLTPYYLYVGR